MSPTPEMEMGILEPQVRLLKTNAHPELMQEARKDAYDFEGFSFTENQRNQIIAGMSLWEQLSLRADRDRQAYKVVTEFAPDAEAILNTHTQTAAARRVIEAMTTRRIAIPDAPVTEANGQTTRERVDAFGRDNLHYVAMLYEMDRSLRGRGGVGGDDARQGILGLPDEVLVEQLNIEMGGDERSFNFQDPEKAAKDIRDAIENYRKKRNQFDTVWIPDYYWQGAVSQELRRHPELFLPGQDILDPKVLARAFDARSPIPGQFRVVPLSERELAKVPAPLRRVVERWQTVQFLINLANSEGTNQQYMRMSHAFLMAEGQDVGTWTKAMLSGIGKANKTFGIYTDATGAKDIAGTKEAVLSPIEHQAVLSLVKTPLVAEMDDGRQIGTIIGVSEVMDTYWGDYSPRMRQNGKDLYVPHNNPNATPVPFDQLTPQQRRLARPVFYSVSENGRVVFNTDPLRPERIIDAQYFMTETPNMREELGGMPWFKRVKYDLMRNGVDFAHMRGFRQIVTDNDRLLNLQNRKVAQRFMEASLSGDAEAQRLAASDFMIIDALFAKHGGEFGAAWGVAYQLQRGRRGDMRLVRDMMSEIDINVAKRREHAIKYKLTLPDMADMLLTYHKAIEFWKMTDMDWTIIALQGRKECRAVWRNPHNPDDSPMIEPIRFRNEMRDGKPVTIAGKMKELEGKFAAAGLTNAELIASADVEEMKRVPAHLRGDAELYQRLRAGDRLIKAVLYARDGWGWDPYWRNQANGIVEACKKARETGDASWYRVADQIKADTFKMYVSTWDSMAPSAAHRSQQEALAILMENAEYVDDILRDFNFGDTLKSVGYAEEGMTSESTASLQGFYRTIYARTSEKIMPGEVDKPGKYSDKYQTIAAEYGTTLLQFEPVLNNAVKASLQKLAFGKPDQLSALQADQLGEAILKEVINMGTIGIRSQSEVANYIKEIVDHFINKLNVSMGHLSAEENEDQIANLFIHMGKFLDGVVDTNVRREVDAWADEAHTTMVGTKLTGVKTLEISGTDQREIAALRGAGFGTEYPDTQTGKSPYVSHGEHPTSAAYVTLERNGVVEAASRKVEVLGAYNHRGGVEILPVLLMSFAEDKAQIHKYFTGSILEKMGISDERMQHINGMIAKAMRENNGTNAGARWSDDQGNGGNQGDPGGNPGGNPPEAQPPAPTGRPRRRNPNPMRPRTP